MTQYCLVSKFDEKKTQTLLFLSICSERFSAETQSVIFDDKPNEASKSHSQPGVLSQLPTTHTPQQTQLCFYNIQFDLVSLSLNTLAAYNLPGVQNRQHNQPRVVWSRSVRRFSAGSPSSRRPCSPSRRRPAAHVALTLKGDCSCGDKAQTTINLERRVCVVRVDDVDATGDLWHHWQEIIPDVTAVPSWGVKRHFTLSSRRKLRFTEAAHSALAEETIMQNSATLVF